MQRFESEFREYSHRHASGALNEITDTGKLSDDAVETLTKAVDEFKRNEFTASDGSSVVPKEKAEKALDEDDVEQETVTVKKN